MKQLLQLAPEKFLFLPRLYRGPLYRSTKEGLLPIAIATAYLNEASIHAVFSFLPTAYFGHVSNLYRSVLNMQAL